MSLFDQVSGFTFPDVLMNKGPLPSTTGGPAGSDGSVDGVINGTSALLQNINPYSIGKSARAGSDRNYQQIPHRQQYIIPKLCLPDFIGEGHVKVSHAVDQGDLAFMLYAGKRAWWTTDDQFATRATPCAFGSIEVVNYILACLQASTSRKWGSIRQDLFEHHPEFYEALRNLSKSKDGLNEKGDPLPHFNDFLVFQAVRVLVQQYFVPHGICAGSEKQGGQHEHDFGHPVQAPVNYVTTMTVDGKNVDLVNYWYGMNIVAGDQLIFRLERQNFSKRYYEVTRYYKQPAKQHVQMEHPLDCWQLVPDVLRHENGNTGPFGYVNGINAWHHHLVTGYWRVAQTFHTRKQNTVAAFHRGMPLEVTFAPVWNSFGSCRDSTYCGNSALSSHVTVFDDQKHLTAEVTADKIEWSYEYRGIVGTNKNTFVLSLCKTDPNKYTIQWDEAKCKVHMLSSPMVTELTQNPIDIDRNAIRRVYVVFADDVSSINQVFSPETHKAVPDPKRTLSVSQSSRWQYECIEATKYTDTSGSGNPSSFAFVLQFSITPVPYRYDVNFLYSYCKNSGDFKDYDARLWRSSTVPEDEKTQKDPLKLLNKFYPAELKYYSEDELNSVTIKVEYWNTHQALLSQSKTITIDSSGNRRVQGYVADSTVPSLLPPLLPQALMPPAPLLPLTETHPVDALAADAAESAMNPAKKKRVKTLKFFDGTADVSTSGSDRAAG